MPHIVLLGDSIFDNAADVPGEPPVIEQLRARLPDTGRPLCWCFNLSRLPYPISSFAKIDRQLHFQDTGLVIGQETIEFVEFWQ